MLYDCHVKTIHNSSFVIYNWNPLATHPLSWFSHSELSALSYGFVCHLLTSWNPDINHIISNSSFIIHNWNPLATHPLSRFSHSELSALSFGIVRSPSDFLKEEPLPAFCQNQDLQDSWINMIFYSSITLLFSCCSCLSLRFLEACSLNAIWLPSKDKFIILHS